MFCVVIFREGYVYFHFLIQFRTDQLFLKAWDKCAGTNGQRIILAFAALEGLAVHKALEIQFRHIAVLHRSVFHGHHSCAVVSLSVDLRVYFFLCHFRRKVVDRNTFIFTKLYFRL